MVFVAVLKTLWRLLNTRARWIFSSLVFLQMLAGVAEMASVLAIFGFVNGLTESPSGKRAGYVARALSRLLDGPVTQEQYVWYGGAGVLLFIVLKNVVSLLTQFAMNRFLMKRNLMLSLDLFRGFINAPYEKLLPSEVPKLQGNIREIHRVYSNNFSAAAQILSDSITIAMVGALLMTANPTLTIASALLFGGVGSLIYWTMQRTLVGMGRDERRLHNEADRYLSQAFNGIIDIRLRDLREAFSKGYGRAISNTSVVTRRVNALKRVPRTTNEVLLTTCIVGSVMYLFSSGGSVDRALPTLVLFGFAGLRVTGFLSRVNGSLQRLKLGAERMEKLGRILDTVRGTNPDGPPPIGRYLEAERPLPEGVDGRLKDRLEVRDVHFRFHKKSPVLKDVSLTIERGQFVAICGPSGGGKSTLLKVIMGLLKPTQGTVVFDGLDVFQHIRAWHRNIAYVGQDLFLTEGTVRENVAFGVSASEIDDNRVREALRLARALEFAEALPDGLQTELEQGRSLSGGQRQRMVIARALYTNPEVLVFDEATASLDNETERDIARAISDLSGTKTIVSVAHRLSSIREANVIYYLHEGTVIARGTFEQLLETCPPFKMMVEAGEISSVST